MISDTLTSMIHDALVSPGCTLEVSTIVTRLFNCSALNAGEVIVRTSQLFPAIVLHKSLFVTIPELEKLI